MLIEFFNFRLNILNVVLGNFLRTIEMVESFSIHMLPQTVEKHFLKFVGAQFEEIQKFLFSKGKVLWNFT